jgi:hypothetical protein
MPLRAALSLQRSSFLVLTRPVGHGNTGGVFSVAPSRRFVYANLSRQTSLLEVRAWNGALPSFTLPSDGVSVKPLGHAI